MFVAVELPVDFTQVIKEVQENFRELGKMKIVPAELVHVTLKFLGEVDEDKIAEITQSLENISCEPFTCLIKGVGIFPNAKRPRVLWLGIEGDFGPLYKQVEYYLEKEGFESDTREFTAHATIARIKHIPRSNMNQFASIVEETEDVEFGKFTVDNFRLKKSILTPEGPVYETLRQFNL
ncbi:RNA 2',3'-cyclic phosphodiesterase [Methanohalophilus halophilus]|uniref:RNA 2',3'-cyclic phosphodiesterase n=1 Tax=Methanohalophilus halophilus TaxID=2177 RepID=A0A3M9L2Z7_9EURY|nr:RNA 2',3'-cyclic phosphodiesterase [Methanohalophilus halophilus]